MIRYHQGKRVKVLRYFVLGGEHYSSVSNEEGEFTVRTSELTEKPENIEDTKQYESKEVYGYDEKNQEVVSGNESTVIEPLEDNVSPDKSDKQVSVFAVNKKGKETALGNLDKLDESLEVKRLKLDVDAIWRVLEGSQKQHKGYTFKAVEE